MYITRDMEAAIMLLNQVILEEMGEEYPSHSLENDEIFEKYLVSLEKEYMLTRPETYIVGKVSNYPANWVTWRTIADGRYRRAFELLREGRMRKKDILKKIIKKLVVEATDGMGTSDPSGLGQPTDTSVKQQTDMAKLAQRYDELDKKARRLNLISKERAALEDERMKVWWELRKLLKQKGVNEDHGLGFSHNVSIPQDQNTMNKSTIKEYNDPNARARAIESSNFDRGMALLYKWSESGVVDFNEFRFLLTHFIQKFK